MTQRTRRRLQALREVGEGVWLGLLVSFPLIVAAWALCAWLRPGGLWLP